MKGNSSDDFVTFTASTSRVYVDSTSADTRSSVVAADWK
jgi:hypothetical protein